MGFQSGLSGLNAASTNLSVIGNNVANASTVGFKRSDAQFADVMANALGGGGNNGIGLGTTVADIAQQFTQGSFTTTSNPLDIAVNGNGFFRMSDGGAVTYSRAGQFHLDNQGFVVNSNNLNLTGYLADVNGTIIDTAPGNLQLSTADLTPNATTAVTAGFNLDSRSVAIAPATVFDATDPTTYTDSTSSTIFDSLGNSHILTLFFRKEAGAGAWNTFATLDGGVGNVTLDAGPSVALAFDTSGALTTPAPPATIAAAITLAAGSGALTPMTVDLDFTNANQFGADFSVNSMVQDGFTSGRLNGFTVADNGIIEGNFTNGEKQILGQVILASFPSTHNLAPLGNGQWTETPESGQALIGVPGTGLLGGLQSSAIEDSNVDLTNELVNMITAQRIYQANAKTIETEDAILQTLVNL